MEIRSQDVLTAYLTLILAITSVTTSNYDYKRVLHLSLLFYEAQRSGHLPPNNRIPWRGDSALNDRGENGEDLTGGYYDAGDFVKFSFTMASTTTLLAWGCLSYKEAYYQAGEWKNMLDALKWATDYFMKCHVSDYEFYGQVGSFQLDHGYWGRPEEMNMSRPAYKIDAQHPGSDLAGEVAAALAATSLVFEDISPEYASLCLKHAKQMYKFATRYRGLYHETFKGAALFYESTGYGDELTWAAAWLFRATGNDHYLDEAEQHYINYRLRERPNEFFYNKKVAGVQVLLAQITYRDEYLDAVQSFCDYSMHRQTRTPKGLVFIEKIGTLCHAANIAFVCLQAANLTTSFKVYKEFAKSQIHYMLGDAGRSYVIGFGENYPMQPYHAASSCYDSEPCGWAEFSRHAPNPHVLSGALVSGPDVNDYYEDLREEYIYNEVTLDYNAGFQSAVAGLQHWQMQEAKIPKQKYFNTRSHNFITTINKTYA
ncbi:hypothetical protein V9T40_005392 [Parthenolecanium corni]|uniref:Endoglucanase n=1 Tax=Parthenolecanium corni TaxID=536013 RepID=A0AAN9TJ39_9HEMI